MNDLISRQAAIAALDGEITVTGRANAEAVRGYANLICDRIKRLPSAQPEIIMCKDCIHSPAAHDNCPLPAQYIVPEGFCHLGRGKDE